jgi:hypothetical protein
MDTSDSFHQGYKFLGSIIRGKYLDHLSAQFSRILHVKIDTFSSARVN